MYGVCGKGVDEAVTGVTNSIRALDASSTHTSVNLNVNVHLPALSSFQRVLKAAQLAWKQRESDRSRSRSRSKALKWPASKKACNSHRNGHFPSSNQIK